MGVIRHIKVLLHAILVLSHAEFGYYRYCYMQCLVTTCRVWLLGIVTCSAWLGELNVISCVAILMSL